MRFIKLMEFLPELREIREQRGSELGLASQRSPVRDRLAPLMEKIAPPGSKRKITPRGGVSSLRGA